MSSPIHVLGISGSLRRASWNSGLLRAAAELLPEGMTLEIFDLAPIPMYNQDLERDPPAAVVELRTRVAAADGLLIATPEYNYSIPGVLKNAIDHASRPYGQSAFPGKPAGVIGCSPGAIGTAMAQQHLRNILAYLDVPTLGQPEAFLQVKEGLFEETGDIGAASRTFLQGWMDRFVVWVKRHAG